MSEIDWDKPLLMKGKNDSEWSVTHYNTGSTMRDFDGRILRIIKFAINGFDSEWVVNEDGEDTNGIMPRVYNAKRTPAVGEVWMCKSGDLLFSANKTGNGWISIAQQLGNDVQPLYPLIKDPKI